MINLNFKNYLESKIGLNQPGRAGQHVWKPETPVFHDLKISNQTHGTKHTKTVDINNGFKPMYPATFKGLNGKDFGSKIKRVPKPKI